MGSSSFFTGTTGYTQINPAEVEAFKDEAEAAAAAASASAASAAASVQDAAGTATPLVDGTAAVGVGTKWAREDHVHPTDTSRADAAATTAALALKAATTYVDAQDALKAPLASPTFTGTPAAPTAAAADNSTAIATTAFTATNGVRNDIVQSLGLEALRQAQSNINLPSIHRRPVTPWLPKWGAAKANVIAGVSNAKLLCIGDSTTAGFGAQFGNVNSASFSLPAYLAAELTAAGLNSSWQSRWADNNCAASAYTINSWDARCAASGDGYAPSAFQTLGGVMFSGDTPYTAPFVFTPTTTFDKVDLYDLTNGTPGTYSASISGVGTITPSQSGALALRMQTITGVLGSGSLVVTPTSTDVTFFIGAIAYNSAVKEVSVINAGYGSGTTGTFNNAVSVWSPLNVLGFLAPDLTIINLTINDSIQSTSLSTYQTNLQAIITKAKISGDVILVGGVPIDPSVGFATAAKQAAINNMASALAAKNSVNFVSMFDLWGSYTDINDAGWSADLQIHPNAAGYAAQAALLAPYLL